MPKIQAWWEGDWWNRPLYPPSSTANSTSPSISPSNTAKQPLKPAIAPNPAKATNVPPKR